MLQLEKLKKLYDTRKNIIFSSLNLLVSQRDHCEVDFRHPNIGARDLSISKVQLDILRKKIGKQADRIEADSPSS